MNADTQLAVRWAAYLVVALCVVALVNVFLYNNGTVTVQHYRHGVECLQWQRFISQSMWCTK
jgi:hypothetical protein